jgi:lipoate-protein ligase A
LSDEISDAQLAELLRARGFDVSKKETTEPVTREQVRDWIREAFEEATGKPSEEPVDPERTFAQNYHDAMQRSRTSQWMGDDAA